MNVNEEKDNLPEEQKPAAEQVEKEELKPEPEMEAVAEVEEVVQAAEEEMEKESPKEEETVQAESTETEEAVEAKPLAENGSKSNEDIEEIEDDEAVHFTSDDIDVDGFEKKDFVALAEKMLDAIKKTNVTINDIRNVDSVFKEIRGAYDEIHGAEIEEAKEAYVKTNGSDEGFAFKNDNFDIRFESLMIQIRDGRNEFYRKLETLREDYFERKTNLLQRLREVVEREEKGGSKENWEAFKEIQNEWRDAGNVNSPHNGSLWSAYNALLDRYFDIRSIQNELKELDRKKNLEVREGFVEKIEEIAESLKTQELTNSLMKTANEYLNEYKHTGPGPRAEQEKLWERMKAAFDVIYDKKRGQHQENEKLMDEIFEAKAALVAKMEPFANFKSDRINEWNAKSKEVLAIQEQWNALKGPMPRDKAKDTSKAFWGNLKSFFKAKSAFFNELEAERKANLEAKEELCKQAEAILASEDTSAENTNKVIELQKVWKTYGHVPQKFKDSIYKRFKTACDGFFDLKRQGNKEQREEYAANLKAKEDLCAQIEAAAKAKETDLDKLNEFKKAYNEIGFVPRSDIKKIQNRFVDAINAYVLNSSEIDKEEKEKLVLKNEVEVSVSSGGSPQALHRQENDLRRKLRSLEDEITQLKTNIEFFGRSKGADKIKAEYEKKIAKAEDEASKLKEKIALIHSVSD
ncbi:DUF349 domain-containing protein [Marinilongibacter aquaticus]|uniref:DUF349 domain-containing protein n=1 Tax=Marinilongibacter aquaticus TaxID=2975157 RepID=UPI0021BDE4F5|nr:DUF349 domain-containing protein [Marinilongibacter aquaticus]UBM58599.1 DUF349 domain-containing protein [Marinilongibacter aquaticus]